MNAEIKAKVKEHAIKDSPYEACGFVVVNGLGEAIVMPCENQARNKRGMFVIDPRKHLEAERLGHIAAFYHSHADAEMIRPEAARFSREDLDISYETCLPALLYTHPNDTWHFNLPATFTPSPLLGRPFVWGVWDCYTLVRDYFLLNKKTVMGSYFPPENPSASSDFGYETLSKNENFHEIPLSEARKDDVLLLKVKSDFINHCLIYQGNNEFLHQPAFKLSSKGVLDDRYQKYVVKTLRYND
jgi:proteasome lid subunit RPN8/RPN11